MFQLVFPAPHPLWSRVDLSVLWPYNLTTRGYHHVHHLTMCWVHAAIFVLSLWYPVDINIHRLRPKTEQHSIYFEWMSSFFNILVYILPALYYWSSIHPLLMISLLSICDISRFWLSCLHSLVLLLCVLAIQYYDFECTW